MALDTYADLQVAILSWLARPGDPLVSPAVPDIIRLFEREATRRLKVGAAEKRAQLTALSSGVALPDDFGELRLATSGGINLTYVPPQQLPALGGLPGHYTIVGNALYLGPSPSGEAFIDIIYQSGVPPLSDANPVNWLLTKHPDCYLFGSLVEAEAFIGHDERIQLWGTRLQAAFESIEQADRKARWNGSPLQIRADGFPGNGGGSAGAGDWTGAPPVAIPITGVVAGQGLIGGGTEGLVTLALQVPVPVALGGSGATTAAAAPWALLPIDLVADIDGVLPIVHGGTGAATAALALDALSGAAGAAAGTLTRASSGVWSVAAVTATYSIGFSFVGGVLAASQLLGLHKMSRAVTFPANFSGSTAGATANATGSTVITIGKALAASPNTFSAVGTLTFAAGGVAATFASTGGTAVSCATGDVLRLIGPATADTTLANVYCTLVGS